MQADDFDFECEDDLQLDEAAFAEIDALSSMAVDPVDTQLNKAERPGLDSDLASALNPGLAWRHDRELHPMVSSAVPGTQNQAQSHRGVVNRNPAFHPATTTVSVEALLAENTRLKRENATNAGEVFNLRAQIEKSEAEVRRMKEALESQSSSTEQEKEAVRRQFSKEIEKLKSDLFFRNQEYSKMDQLRKAAVKQATTAASLAATLSQHQNERYLPTQQLGSSSKHSIGTTSENAPTHSNFASIPTTIEAGAFVPLRSGGSKDGRNLTILLLLKLFLPNSSRAPFSVLNQSDSTVLKQELIAFLECIHHLALDPNAPPTAMLPLLETLLSNALHEGSQMELANLLLKALGIVAMDRSCCEAMVFLKQDTTEYTFMFHEQAVRNLTGLIESKHSPTIPTPSNAKPNENNEPQPKAAMHRNENIQAASLMLNAMTQVVFTCLHADGGGNDGISSAVDAFAQILDAGQFASLFHASGATRIPPVVISECAKFLTLAMSSPRCFHFLVVDSDGAFFDRLCKCLNELFGQKHTGRAKSAVIRLVELIAFKYLHELCKLRYFNQSVQRFLNFAYQESEEFLSTKVQSVYEIQKILRIVTVLFTSMVPHRPETSTEYQFVAVLLRTKHVPDLFTVSDDLIDFYAQ
ncbi:hypothetical protein HDU80_007280 [Chytriomyces hyalinus]|nr:hypothetical protein HDU80_007280 [Chytriomyces hyalinus]